MENEVKKNSIALANTTSVSSDLFGDSNVRKVTSLDLNDENQMDMFINSQQEADYKLNDFAGKTIKFIGATIAEYPKTEVDEETGEEITRKKHTLCLFDEEGKSYVTGSGSCYFSFANIVAFKGMPTVEKSLTLEIVKVPSDIKGHEYLKVKLAK